MTRGARGRDSRLIWTVLICYTRLEGYICKLIWLCNGYIRNTTLSDNRFTYLFFPPPNPPKPIISSICISPPTTSFSPASALFLSSLFFLRSSFLASFSDRSASLTADKRVLKSKLAAVVLCFVSSLNFAIRALTWERVDRSVRFVCPRFRRSIHQVYSELEGKGDENVRKPEFRWSRYDIESFKVRLQTSH